MKLFIRWFEQRKLTNTKYMKTEIHVNFERKLLELILQDNKTLGSNWSQTELKEYRVEGLSQLCCVLLNIAYIEYFSEETKLHKNCANKALSQATGAQYSLGPETMPLATL